MATNRLAWRGVAAPLALLHCASCSAQSSYSDFDPQFPGLRHPQPSTAASDWSAPLPQNLPLSTPFSSTVSFYSVGDVPYSPMESCMIPYELNKLLASEALFLIHLGDIRDGKPYSDGTPRECPRALYDGIASLFQDSPVPTFFLPGDNGWLDCADATEAYGFWKEFLLDFTESRSFPTPIHRWADFPTNQLPRSSTRFELFSFLYSSVLFVSASLPGQGRDMDNEWTPKDSLLLDSAAWVQDNLEAFQNQYGAVVLFGHSSWATNNLFFERFKSFVSAGYSTIPFLFLEDAHILDVEFGFRGMANVMRIAQDDTVTPMRITVDISKRRLDAIFQYERRCPCSTNHRPTELVFYDAGGECAAECVLQHNQCRDREPCSPEPSFCQD